MDEGLRRFVDETCDAVAAAVRASNEATALRLDSVEARLNRMALGGTESLRIPKPKSAEMKSWETFLRKGPEAVDRSNAALVISDDTAGGYLAPEQFEADLARNIVLFSPIRQLARISPISGASVRMPRRTGTMTASWVGETQTRSETQPAYGQDRFDVKEMACYVDISNSALEDSEFDMLAELSFDFAEEFGRLEGAGFVNGTGPLQPEGYMTRSDIPSVNSGSATTVTADALIEMQQALKPAYRANATWVMNSSSFAKVRRLKDGTGQYLITLGGSLVTAPTTTLLGRPVVEAPDMPDEGSGAYPIILADFQQLYRIFDRVQLAIIRDPLTQATNGITRFHARRRVAGGARKVEAGVLMKIST